MADEGVLDKETFLRIAEGSGLDVKDEAHMEELYKSVRGVLPGLRKVDELDLAGLEPSTIYIPSKE